MSLRHHLTSFGYSLDANLFLKESLWNWLIILHDYEGGNQSMPGIEIQLLHYPMTLKGQPWFLSSRVMAWEQPTGQSFGKSPQVGGLASVRFTRSMSRTIDVYWQLESKSQGWVAGNAYLESNLALLLGLEIPISL